MHSDQLIDVAKQLAKYSTENVHHNENDRIRAAYEWLDAQRLTKHPTKKVIGIKHLVEKWCGNYISRSDVETAAHMHPAIFGIYPFYNINAGLVLPSIARLSGLTRGWHEPSSKRNSRYRYRENDDQRLSTTP